VVVNVDNFRDWVVFTALTLLGIVSYFLKRAIDTVDKMEEKLHSLELRIAVILDRDRRRRLDDYENEKE
jgi:hypothetical protein